MRERGRCEQQRRPGIRGHEHGARGDYMVTVVPTFPDSLSAEQEALLDQLGALNTGPVRARRKTSSAS